MSKLSFRARALDACKPMPIFHAEDIPDLPDFAAINRAVPQMPTGMEKEEECEHHLQRAISAQQAFGHTGELVIPTPEVYTTPEYLYDELYPSDYKIPRQLIHMQPFAMDQDIPDYDMDSDDDRWLSQQAKKMDITPYQFEEMMDRLEKSSGQQVITLKEAKVLLKEDDDLIIAVYDYWLNKRLKTQCQLIPQVKTEKRDGSTNNNPYVAFRRRTEKMQTRKNRKNDEASYEKMLKLRRDLSRAVTLIEMVKRREKTKREHLHLTIEILEKRFQVGDFSGQILAECNAMKNARPSYVPVNNNKVVSKQDSRVSRHKEEGIPRRKREYTKRKHKPELTIGSQGHVAHRTELDSFSLDLLSSDDDILSPGTSPSDQEDENDPDGLYAFRRKKCCSYHAPIVDRLGNWPWCSPEEGGLGDRRYRYCLTSLSLPRPRCIGFARRRIGRGGRVLLDRAWTPFDDFLSDLDLTASRSLPNGLPPSKEFLTEIKNEWLHFRPEMPQNLDCLRNSFQVDSEVIHTTVENGSTTPVCVPSEFDLESFQNHQEELFEMQRKQLERLKQEELSADSSQNSEHSFSSQPTSRFLDSASVQFAVSAVLSASEVSGILNSLISSSSSAATSPILISAADKPIASITSCHFSRAPTINGPVTERSPADIEAVSVTSSEGGDICKENSMPPVSSSTTTLPSSVLLDLPMCTQVEPSTDLESRNSVTVSDCNLSYIHPVCVVPAKAINPAINVNFNFSRHEQNGKENMSVRQEDISLGKSKVETVTSEDGIPMDVT